MTLLDLYTAGATEYVAVLFTTLFGSFGLLELAKHDEYGRFRSTLSWVYLLASLVAAWSVARIIGTEFLLAAEMKNEGLLTTYQTQVATWDPLAAGRLVSLFAGPQFYVLYLGAPIFAFCVIIKVWLRLVYDMGLRELFSIEGLRKVFREKHANKS